MGKNRQQASRDQESVSEYAIVHVKEAFAVLLNYWRAAVERPQDKENVHQLRVSSRRAQAALEVFDGLLPSRRAKRMSRLLDRVRKSAGPVRDVDVFREQIRDRFANPDSAASVDAYLHQQRCAGQDGLVKSYEKNDRGEKMEKQVSQLLKALRPRGRRNKKLNSQLCTWVRHQLRSASRQFFADAKIDTADLELLHAFRIRVKQFRYFVEHLRSALQAAHYKKANSDLKKLSGKLGGLNDHASAVERLEVLLEVDFPADVQQALQRWSKQERRALRDSMADFKEWWSAKRQRRLRRRLKRATRIDREMCLAQ